MEHNLYFCEKYLYFKFMKFSLTLIMALNLFFNKAGSQNHKPHFAIFINEEKEPFKVECSTYKVVNKKIKKDSTWKSLEELSQSLIALGNSNKNLKILYYIHGYMAHQKAFEESTGHTLQTNMFDSLEVDVVISLKWSAGIDYPKNIPISEMKGRRFAEMIVEIDSTLSGEGINTSSSFLCHSMGNRVFKACLNGLESFYLNNQDHSIDKVLLVAADIPNDVFENDLRNITDVVNKTYVFYNIDDRTLKTADKLLRPYKRLGVYGWENFKPKGNNIMLINTTGLKDNEGFAPNMTLHRYYYSSPSFRTLTIDILNGKESSQLNGDKVDLLK